ncbi:hypothetical protein OD350_26265 [Clostridium beijerinckii]|uniref:lanthionine synthetase LanC family protein n=1 Tax=Clostridium beijerinckii TaxID=1520 RepID=UPI002225CDD8|nr:lanthionine synthetase LanC family protein [Clostridium beijerinckii]UYZ35648.1 hypothetical protein OD350_26265 [Clostridium beijerinckii]
MLSKTKPCNDVEKIINEILLNRYLTSITISIIKDFFKNIANTNIISNKEEFLRDILVHFNNYKVEESKINDYLNLATKAIRFVEKNLFQLEKEILKEKGARIKEIRVFLDNETVIVIFTDNSKVLFFKYNILKKYSLFNEVVCYLNKKITKENNIQSRKILSNRKYCLLDASELVKEKDLFKYYFKSGELLVILYLLCCKNVNELFSLRDSIIDNNFSASNIAHHMLDSSVYNIDFLPLNKVNLVNFNIGAIKSGFEYMYNITLSNKSEFISFIKDIFASNLEYLGNILKKINILNEEDLKMQLYLIDAKFLTNESSIQQIILLGDEGPCRVDRKRFIKLAGKLGDHLIKKSIIGYSNGNISRTWINFSEMKRGKKSEVSDSLYDLYNGNSGMALFFVYLGEVTQKKYFINASLEIMQESIEVINNMSGDYQHIVYELFTLSKIYSITKNKTIEFAINKGILFIYKIIKEGNIDNISASYVAIILSIYDVIECNKTKKMIIELGNILYKNIEFEDRDEEVLLFLIKFISITRNKEIKATIERLLTFKGKKRLNKSHFQILLNRLKLKEVGYNDKLVNKEINEALSYIIKNEFNGSKSSYYNKDIVNIEILEYAAEVLENESLKNRCINTYNNIVNKIIEPAIYEEMCYGNKPISLMRGIAGYGYSLIRMCGDRRTIPILSVGGIVYMNTGKN